MTLHLSTLVNLSALLLHCLFPLIHGGPTPLPLSTITSRIWIVNPKERYAVALSFIYFFSLLCAYYILRPIRDEMGIQGGIENLPWVFTGTFLAMLVLVPLFGWLTSRFRRATFLPASYGFFISHLLIFYFLIHWQWSPQLVAQIFFIWVSVFNLFIVSVFWSYMNDIFDQEQATRLFAIIAAGGTCGALCGPLLTSWLVQPMGSHNLLLLCALLLSLSIFLINRLSLWQRSLTQSAEHRINSEPLSGHWLSGITLITKSPYLMGVCLYMLIFTTLSTFLYFHQAHIIEAYASSSEQRTQVFAQIDLAVNSLTLLLQLFVTGFLVQRIGLAWLLAIVPLLLSIGFLSLGMAPILGVFVIVQVARRAGNYAIMRPGREMLYTVLAREEKYKAKNFIDTAVYRGGDAVSAWVYNGLRSLGLGLSQIAYIAVPIALAWAWIAFRLGRRRALIAAKGDRHELPTES